MTINVKNTWISRQPKIHYPY